MRHRFLRASKRWLLYPGCGLVALMLGVPSARADTALEAKHLLRAAAGASPRPMECTQPSSGAVRSLHDVWRQARAPKLARYCDLLAHGYARLSEAPGEALEASEQAAKTQPKRSTPFLLRARALHALGRDREAWPAYEMARQAEPGLRLSPEAQLDYARTGRITGRWEAALAAYRQLVPMAGLLSVPGARESVYVEAAMLLVRSGPEHADEAAAYLNEARRRNATPMLTPYILAGLAVALDRQGRSEEARGVVEEARGRTQALEIAAEGKALSTFGYLEMPALEPSALLAMLATLSAADDASLATSYWTDLVEGASADDPWATYARQKLTPKGG